MAVKLTQVFLDLDDKLQKPKKNSRQFYEDIDLTSFEAFHFSLKKHVARFIGCSASRCKITEIYALKKCRSTQIISTSAHVMKLQLEKTLKIGIKYREYN